MMIELIFCTKPEVKRKAFDNLKCFSAQIWVLIQPEIENLKPARNKQLRADESFKNQTKNSVLTSAEIWTQQG